MNDSHRNFALLKLPSTTVFNFALIFTVVQDILELPAWIVELQVLDPVLLQSVKLQPSAMIQVKHFKVIVFCPYAILKYLVFPSKYLESTESCKGSYDKRRNPKRRSGQTSEWKLNLT